MRRVRILTFAAASLGAAGLVAFQTQPAITPVPIGTISGLNVEYVTPALGTTRLYITDGDTGLWMYDRVTKRRTLVSRGEVWEPTISRAGDRVAFGRPGERGNTEHIWSMPLDQRTGLAAGPARRVSMSQGDVPSFSPDGKFIAFGRYHDSTPSWQDVTVVPSNGGQESILARLSSSTRGTAWMPDGKSIVFIGSGPPPAAHPNQRIHSVQRVSSAGGQPELVTQTTGPGLLSPDGRLLLTTSGFANEVHYVISDPTGKKLGEFSLQAGTNVAAWTGPTTLLTTTSLTSSIITIVSGIDRQKRRLTNSSNNAIAPTWSPDGRRLAYLQWNGSRLDHMIMNADGTGKKTIPGHRDFVAVPPGRGFDWSPDGTSIVYSGDPAAYYVIDATTGRERKTNAPTRQGSNWWPDSRSFLYSKLVDSTTAGFRRELHLLNPDGRDRILREVTFSSNCPACYNLIGDSVIVFGRHEGTSVASLRNSSAPRKLFPGDTTSRSNPTVSPNGQWLVFRVIGMPAFDVVRVDGSSLHRIKLPVNLLQGGGGGGGGGGDQVLVTPDSRELLFIGRDVASNREIGVYRVPLAGGDARKVLTLDDAASATLRDFSISPDGNTVAYVTAGQPSTSLGEINIAPYLPRAPR